MEIPVQAGEMPLLQWLSFQNILPGPDMKENHICEQNPNTSDTLNRLYVELVLSIFRSLTELCLNMLYKSKANQFTCKKLAMRGKVTHTGSRCKIIFVEVSFYKV